MSCGPPVVWPPLAYHGGSPVPSPTCSISAAGRRKVRRIKLAAHRQAALDLWLEPDIVYARARLLFHVQHQACRAALPVLPSPLHDYDPMYIQSRVCLEIGKKCDSVDGSFQNVRSSEAPEPRNDNQAHDFTFQADVSRPEDVSIVSGRATGSVEGSFHEMRSPEALPEPENDTYEADFTSQAEVTRPRDVSINSGGVSGSAEGSSQKMRSSEGPPEPENDNHEQDLPSQVDVSIVAPSFSISCNIAQENVADIPEALPAPTAPTPSASSFSKMRVKKYCFRKTGWVALVHPFTASFLHRWLSHSSEEEKNLTINWYFRLRSRLRFQGRNCVIPNMFHDFYNGQKWPAQTPKEVLKAKVEITHMSELWMERNLKNYKELCADADRDIAREDEEP